VQGRRKLGGQPFAVFDIRIIDLQGGGMHISEILGKGVLDLNANSVGKVVDVDVSLPEWTINHIVVKMGLIKKLTIGLDKIDKVGDKIILKVTKDELEKSPLAAK
jgi:sporulation protein YlmC with PRC-barrel domain